MRSTNCEVMASIASANVTRAPAHGNDVLPLRRGDGLDGSLGRVPPSRHQTQEAEDEVLEAHVVGGRSQVQPRCTSCSGKATASHASPSLDPHLPVAQDE